MSDFTYDRQVAEEKARKANKDRGRTPAAAADGPKVCDMSERELVRAVGRGVCLGLFLWSFVAGTAALVLWFLSQLARGR